MKTTLTEPIGYLETIALISEIQEDITIFTGLIEELKSIKRPYKVHKQELDKLISCKKELRSTLLN